MDVCKVSDTSKVRISRTDHRPPERAREASERGGSLKSFLPDRPSTVGPKRRRELHTIAPVVKPPKKLTELSHHLPPEPLPSRRTHRFPKYTGNCFARFSPPPDRISAVLGFPEPQLSVSEFQLPSPPTPLTKALIRMHPNTEFTAKIASYCDEICDLDLAQSRGPTDIRSFLSIPTTSPMLNMPPCHEESPTFVTISYPTIYPRCRIFDQK